MDNMYTTLGQAVITIAKIVILIFLPVVSFVVPILNITIPGISVTGMTMLNRGGMLILIPLIMYVIMLLMSFGPLQKFSWIAAVAALIVEIIFMSISSALLNGTDIAFLLSLIPQEYQQYVDVGLTQLARPGLGLVINLILSIVFVAWYFVGGMLFGNNHSGRSGNGNGMTRANVSQVKSQQIGGGINRPRI